MKEYNQVIINNITQHFFISTQCHTMAQAVGHQLLNTEIWVQFQLSAGGIFNEQSGTGTDLLSTPPPPPPKYFGFSHAKIIPPMLTTHSSVYPSVHSFIRPSVHPLIQHQCYNLST
jgi:hypothetical protein